MKPVTSHCFRFVVTLAAMLATLHAGERALIDLTRSPHAIMYMPDLADVRWTGGLLGERFDVARDTMVPHLGRLMSDPKTSPAWLNDRSGPAPGRAINTRSGCAPPRHARARHRLR